MKKNKLFGYVMTGALTLGVIGGAGIQAFAATNNTAASVEQAVNVKASLDDETKQKVQTIMEELKSQLADLGVNLPTKGIKDVRSNLFENLDGATKEKAQAIIEQVKAGSITFEEAQTQLAELGVDLPAKGFKVKRDDIFANLDEATKEKAQAILEQERAGTITREEAQTQLAELGVDLPAKGFKVKHDDIFANLDDATKEKVQAILEQERAGTITREEAQTQLAELGVDLPAKKGNRGDLLDGLDDATKEKAQALIDAAQEQLTELGVEHLPFKGFGEF